MGLTHRKDHGRGVGWLKPFGGLCDSCDSCDSRCDSRALFLLKLLYRLIFQQFATRAGRAGRF